MPAYNFKQKFAPKVGSGEKRHTVRAIRKDGKRPKAGQPFTYTGMRTKYCEPILFSTIKAVEDITIAPDGALFIAGRRLAVKEAQRFAIADGFASFTEFLDFFRSAHGLPFSGDLIHWTFNGEVVDSRGAK